MFITADDASRRIRAGQISEPIHVSGRLDLTGFERETLPEGLHCYELDLSGSRITRLPGDLRVDGRLVLDNCPGLTGLPSEFSAGSISLRNCTRLRALPEKLSTWFLDMTGCAEFESWPAQATIHNGSLILRNCTSIRSLPRWIGRLAQLDLAGCVQLTEIPDGVAVSGWLDVGGTMIDGLPPSLQGASLRWRGVRVNERIAFHPEQLAGKEVVAEKNAEVRRVMMERMGYLRFAQETKAKVLDKDNDPGGPRQLLHIELDQDEPLVGLVCLCPSTGRQYFIRVPPATKTCHQAAAWIAGFDDPILYRPRIET